MLSWLRRHKQERKVANLFGQYAPPEVIKELTARHKKPAALNVLQTGPVEFVLISVHCPTDSDTGAELGLLAERGTQAEWMVQAIMSNLVLFVSGVLPSAARAEPRNTFVPRLIGPRSKAVHGLRQAPFGLLGGSSRMTYGAVLPDFLTIVCALQQLEIGHAKQLDGPPSD